MVDRQEALLRSVAQQQAMPSAEELQRAASKRNTEAVTAAKQHNATLTAQAQHALSDRDAQLRELARRLEAAEAESQERDQGMQSSMDAESSSLTEQLGTSQENAVQNGASAR